MVNVSNDGEIADMRYFCHFFQYKAELIGRKTPTLKHQVLTDHRLKLPRIVLDLLRGCYVFLGFHASGGFRCSSDDKCSIIAAALPASAIQPITQPVVRHHLAVNQNDEPDNNRVKRPPYQQTIANPRLPLPSTSKALRQ